MRISGSIFLIALGAILRFAVTVSTRGFSIHTIGDILMVAGAGALIITLVFLSQRSRGISASVVDPIDPMYPADGVTEERRVTTYREGQSRPYSGPNSY